LTSRIFSEIETTEIKIRKEKNIKSFLFIAFDNEKYRMYK
jgi:hypothetical protein